MGDDQQVFKIFPEYEPDWTLRYVPVTDEFAVPRRFTAKNETVSLRIEIDDDGQPLCRAVEVRGERLSSDDLRLPLARILRRAVASAAVAVTPDATGAVAGAAVLAGLLRRGKREHDFYQQYTSTTDRPRRGVAVTDERLERVASVYRAALENGDPPTETVGHVLHASRSTAARWVAAARKRGLLGPATPGKAGER